MHDISIIFSVKIEYFFIDVYLQSDLCISKLDKGLKQVLLWVGQALLKMEYSFKWNIPLNGIFLEIHKESPIEGFVQ